MSGVAESVIVVRSSVQVAAKCAELSPPTFPGPEHLFEVSDDAYAEPEPRIAPRQVRVAREVAKGRDLQLVGWGVGHATVVVVPVPQEVVAGWLRRQGVEDLDHI